MRKLRLGKGAAQELTAGKKPRSVCPLIDTCRPPHPLCSFCLTPRLPPAQNGGGVPHGRSWEVTRTVLCPEPSKCPHRGANPADAFPPRPIKLAPLYRQKTMIAFSLALGNAPPRRQRNLRSALSPARGPPPPTSELRGKDEGGRVQGQGEGTASSPAHHPRRDGGARL